MLLLSAASLCTDVASEGLYPLLPLYFTSVLGATTLSLGLIEGIAEATAAMLKPFSGAWSDRRGSGKPLVVGGYLLSNITKAMLGLVTTWPQALAFRFLDRVGKGLRSAPRDAWLAKSAPKEHLARVFGFHRGMDHLGAVIGPLLASAYLMKFPGDIQSLFLLSLVPGLAAVGFTLVSREPAVPSRSGPKPPAGWRNFRAFPPSLKRLLLVLFIFTLGNSSDAFLLLRLDQAGIERSRIPLLWAGLHIVKMVVSLYSPFVCQRLGLLRTILVGWIWYALVYLGLGLTSSEVTVTALFLSYGIFHGLTEGPERALIARLAPAEARGSAFGSYGMSVALAALPASLLFGGMWQWVGMSAAFYLGAGIAFISALLLCTVREQAPN